MENYCASNLQVEGYENVWAVGDEAADTKQR